MNDDIQPPQPEEQNGGVTSPAVKKMASKLSPYIAMFGVVGMVIVAFVIGFAIAWSFIKWREPAPTTYAGGYSGGSLGCYLDDPAFDDTTTVTDADWVINKIGGTNADTLKESDNKIALEKLIQTSKDSGVNPAILISFWGGEQSFKSPEKAFGCYIDGKKSLGFEASLRCAIDMTILPAIHSTKNSSSVDYGLPKNANRWDRLLYHYVGPKQEIYDKFGYTTAEDDARIKILKRLVPDQVVCRSPQGILPIVYYNQASSPWGSMNLTSAGQRIFSSNSKNIGTSGCGLTSTAMVVSYFTKKPVLPSQIAEDVVRAQGEGAGANFSGYLPTIKKLYGVDIRKGAGDIVYYNPSSDKEFPIGWVRDQINNDHPIMLRVVPGDTVAINWPSSISGPGEHFGGHYMVIRGVDSDNNLIINEPLSEKRVNLSINYLSSSRNFEMYPVYYNK